MIFLLRDSEKGTLLGGWPTVGVIGALSGEHSPIERQNG